MPSCKLCPLGPAWILRISRNAIIPIRPPQADLATRNPFARLGLHVFMKNLIAPQTQVDRMIPYSELRDLPACLFSPRGLSTKSI